MGVVFIKLLMLKLLWMFFVLMFSATDRKYLLKVSAICCWFLINFPSTFNVHIVPLFVFLLVSSFTISNVVLFLLLEFLILLSYLSFLASLITVDKILQYFF
jgi:hypothetical protein